MSRSGYVEDEGYDGQFAMWRGQVASAARGRRGQRFFRDLIAALDAMPEKRLITDALVREEPPCDLVRWLFAADKYDEHVRWEDAAYSIEWPGDCGVCALGALGQYRAIDMSGLDPHDNETVGAQFDIARQLACEVVYENDEVRQFISVPPTPADVVAGRRYRSRPETPEERWARMRAWAASYLGDGDAKLSSTLDAEEQRYEPNTEDDNAVG